jgi:hypothetical protein
MAQAPLIPNLPVPLSLPPLVLGPVKFKIGTLQCLIRPAEDVQAIEQGEATISPKVIVPIYVSPSGDRLIVVRNKASKRPNGVDGVLVRDTAGKLRWVSHRLVTTSRTKRPKEDGPPPSKRLLGSGMAKSHSRKSGGGRTEGYSGR